MPFPNFPLNRGHLTRTQTWGDVYWFDFGRPTSNQFTIAGARPCVIMSDLNTLVGQTVVVCPATGVEHAIPGYDYHVLVTRAEFSPLDKDSVFKVDHLYNIDQGNLIDEHYIGTLPLLIMKRIYLQMLDALNVRQVV